MLTRTDKSEWKVKMQFVSQTLKQVKQEHHMTQ